MNPKNPAEEPASFELTEDLLVAVSQMQISARRNLGALLAGNYRSSFRGSGMQFKEFRHYEPGDDIRHMSWTVTARTGKATVKIYEEEREIDIILVLDVSGSSIFRFRQKRKIDMYAELLALIGLAAIRSGDNVGTLLFTDRPGRYLPARRTRNHVMTALTHLLSEPLRGRQSDLRPALDYAINVLKNRSLVIIVSDFLVPPFDEKLIQLAQRHEIIMLHCYDNSETGMNLTGIHEVWDPEAKEFSLLDGNSEKLKSTLGQQHMELSRRLEALSHRAKADYLCLSVEDDYVQRLVHFFRSRGPCRL